MLNFMKTHINYVIYFILQIFKVHRMSIIISNIAAKFNNTQNHKIHIPKGNMTVVKPSSNIHLEIL